MGSWSSGPFGNDTALDWVAQLSEATNDTLLKRALAVVLNSAGPPDSDDCEEALAAAAVIRAACGASLRSLPDEARTWIIEQGYVPKIELIERAILALNRIVDDSELLQAWSEAGSAERWKRSVQTLIDGLRKATARPSPQRTTKKPAAPRLLSKLIAVISPEEQSNRREKLQTELNGLADVNAPLPQTLREPPLCLIAARGLIPEATSLLDRGANPNAESGMGDGPVAYAASNGRAAMVELLVGRGARLNKTIFLHKSSKIPTSQTDADAIPFVLTPGIFGAARRGCISTLQVFAKLGADLRQVDLNGETLLHKAAESAPPHMLEYLVGYGLDINQVKNLKETALHYAVRANRIEIVQCLLNLGAHPNIIGEVDGTPLDILRNPKGPVGKLLREHGGKLARELKT